MPQPTGRDLYVDGLLTNVSIGYKNASYICDTIAPMVSVQKQSGIVPKFDQSAWFRDEAKLRSPGTKSQGSGYTTDVTDKYFCDRYSFRTEIADEDRGNAAAPFDLDMQGTELIADKVAMAREVKCAGDFFKTGVWGTDKTGVTDFTQWSSYATSNPLEDISTYMDSVEGLIAREPNLLVLGKQVWLKLKWHPDVIDTIKYTQRAQMTVDLFAALVELEKILIGRAIYTTSAEGTAEASVSYSRIWGKSGLLLYQPGRPALMTPAAMYTFVWERVAAALQYIKRMRDEEREVDILEANSYFDQKLTAKNAGLFLKDAVA